MHTSLIVQPFYFIRKSHYKDDLQNFYLLYLNMEKSKNVLSLNYNYHKTNVFVEDIIYISSYGHQLTVITKDGEFYDNRSMKDIELYLINLGYFVRVHKSYIINLEYLVSYNKKNLTLMNDTIISLGRKYKDSFKTKYQEFLLK